MMIKLGKKYGGTEVSSPKSFKDQVHYPYLSLDKLPSNGLAVGDVIVAKVKLRLKRCSATENEDGKNYSCDFDVLAIDLPAKGKSDLEYAVNQEKTKRRS